MLKFTYRGGRYEYADDDVELAQMLLDNGEDKVVVTKQFHNLYHSLVKAVYLIRYLTDEIFQKQIFLEEAERMLFRKKNK